MELLEEKQVLKAVRKRCLECAGNAEEVSKCISRDCSLFFLRFGKKDPNKVKRVNTRVKSYCLECCNYSEQARRECDITECHLYEINRCIFGKTRRIQVKK